MDIEIDYLSLVDEHINERESETAELMKVLSTAGKEFFQFLEETENTFKNDLAQGAAAEMEVVNNQPELGLNPVRVLHTTILSIRSGRVFTRAEVFKDIDGTYNNTGGSSPVTRREVLGSVLRTFGILMSCRFLRSAP